MGEQFVLSGRTLEEIKEMHKWWRQNKNKLPQPLRRRSVGIGGGAAIGQIKFFEVMSEHELGHGLYYCYEQQFISYQWHEGDGKDKFSQKSGAELTEVFNLYEYHPIDDAMGYTPMLGIYDLIMAQRVRDSGGTLRWMGVPLGNPVRQVKATEDAPAADHITCNLILSDGTEATEAQLGYHIKVYGNFITGSNLNEVMPRITTGKILAAYNEQGKWYFHVPFWKLDIC